MTEPTPPPVTPSPDPPAGTTPVTPAEPTTPPAEPTTPPAEPTAPAAAPASGKPTAPAEPAPSQAPPATPPAEPPAASDPPAAPPEGGPRVVPKADGYTLPKGAPAELGQFANQNDMTQEQLDATLTQFGGFITRSRQTEQLNMRKAGEEHVKSWGDNSKYNLTLAKRALKQNDPEGKLTKALNESGYGNHPAVLDFLYSIGKSMKEGGFMKSAIKRPPGKKTAAQSMYPNLPSVDN